MSSDSNQTREENSCTPDHIGDEDSGSASVGDETIQKTSDMSGSIHPNSSDTTTLSQSQGFGGIRDYPTQAIPRRLGQIALKYEIGQGGMGVVWRGYDDSLARDVAVKFLSCSRNTLERELAAVLDGTRATAEIQNERLTTIFHADFFDNTPYLVMEYVDGMDLATLLRVKGPFSVEVLVAIMEEVCVGLEALHKKRVLHRDIKPSNVLVSVDGHIKVTDFGLAIGCNRSGMNGVFGGTPLYMAPEVFDGECSVRSDIYALGIMAYELLTGSCPFGGSIDELKQSHRNASLPLAPLQKHGVNSDVKDVILRATNKSQVLRYKSTSHFLRALRLAIQDATQHSHSSNGLRRAVLDVRAQLSSSSIVPGISAPIDEAATSNGSISSISERISTKRKEARESASKSKAKFSQSSFTDGICVDLDCVHCEYNIRGLTVACKCPECGNSIRDSLHRERLIFANVDWLQEYSAALKRLNYGLLIIPVFALLMAFASSALVFSGRNLIAMVAISSIFVMFWAATLKPLFDRDPQLPSNDKDKYFAIKYFWPLAIPVAIFCKFFLKKKMGFYILVSLIKSAFKFNSSMGITFLVFCFLIPCGCVFFDCVHQIAKRIPDSEMMKRARISIRAVALFGSLFLLYTIFEGVALVKLIEADAKPTANYKFRRTEPRGTLKSVKLENGDEALVIFDYGEPTSKYQSWGGATNELQETKSSLNSPSGRNRNKNKSTARQLIFDWVWAGALLSYLILLLGGLSPLQKKVDYALAHHVDYDTVTSHGQS